MPSPVHGPPFPAILFPPPGEISFTGGPMIPNGALVFYKGKPALARNTGDRLELTIPGAPAVKVRPKDVELLHPGPLAKVPDPRPDGDFETAWEMSAGETLDLEALCELVFGRAGPEEALACRMEALDGLRFRAEEGSPGFRAVSREEREKEAARRARKESESADREAFLVRARAGRFEPGDERFLGEVEAFALGASQRARILGDLGLPEKPEAVHAWLLKTARWTDAVNPWPTRFGAAAKAPDLGLGPEDDGGRIDLTGMEAWAIDNAWSRDPDDAISFDGRDVWVHVADPASAILPGSPADREAADRAATLYLPESSVPMLPDSALDRFGLGLSGVSRALSVRISLEPEGSVREAEILPSFVKVARLSYGQADPVLGSGPLAELDRIAKVRNDARSAAGAVDIAIPEVRVWVDSGEPRIDPIPEYRSSAVVREMMVLAGEAAARWAFDRSLPFPYYSQEAPQDAASLPSGLAGEFAKRRLMKAGMAGPQPRAHRGLGVPFYAQFTSPLRRYSDLLAHHQVRAVLAGRKPMAEDEISALLGRAAAAAALIRQAERASQLHWTLAWLGRRPGWIGEGVVVGAGNPATVYIPCLGLETRVPLTGTELNKVISLRLTGVDLARQEARFEATG